MKRVATGPRLLRMTAPALLAAVLLAPIARAQESAPVTIDASPTGAELLRRARESAAANPVESARALQEAVDRFSRKLVPWDDSTDRYQNTADAAERFLLSNAQVRESWLREESAAAQRQLDQGDAQQVAELRALTPAGLQAMMLLAQQALDEGRVSSARRWIDKSLRHPSLDPAKKKLLENARRSIEAPAPAAAAPPAREASAEATTVAQWRPLWSAWLPEAWLNRHVAEADPQALALATRDAAATGTALLATARFSGDGVLIADGVTVRLLDRHSGLERWQHSIGSPEDQAKLVPSDLAVAVPAGDLVITLPGHALLEQRSGLPRVTALSLLNGARQWDVHFDRLGRTEFDELFPHGEPLVFDDVVVVQARKSNSRLESAAWLIALDRATGALRWANSLGAAGGVRLAVSRPLSSPSQFEGDVIAATSLGVVARIDASNGHVLWLRRWSAPLREPRTSNPAWQLPSPVVANDRVYWIQPDQNTLVCLSAADGSEIWSAMLGVNEQLPAARSLLADAQRLYLLSEDVVAVDIADPRRAIWKLSEQLKEPVTVRGESSLGADRNGRPLLAVPLAGRAVLLDPETGRLVGELPLEAGGNLSLREGQLATVDAQRVTLSMEAAEGERLLRARLALNPGDPRSGLALFELGRTWGRSALMLDGATAMSAAINKDESPSGALRDELLRRLLEVLGMKEIDLDTQSKLLAIARSTARTSTQRAALALRMGDLAAEQGKLEEALDQWISLLESKEMRDELVGDDPRRTSARVAALERVVARPLTAVMAPRRRAAEKARAEMRECGDLALVHAAHVAALLAGAPGEAGAVLQEAEQLARSRGLVNAAQICKAMRTNDPPGTRWPGEAGAGPLPKLGSAEPRATTLVGRLLSMSAEAQDERPRTSMLFAEPASLLLRGGDDLGIIWRSNFGDRDPSVMAMSPGIVLWCPQSRDDGALLALNPKDGATVWRLDSVQTLFQPERIASMGLATANDRADAAALACLRAGPVCALIRNDGEVVGVSNATGAVQWSFASAIHAIDWQESSPSLVVIAGRETATSEELTSNPNLIQAIDAAKGAVSAQRVLPKEWGRVRWLQILPDCLLVATDEMVAALELESGLPTRWTQLDRRYKDSPPAQVAGSWCLLRERSGNVVALSMATGRASAMPFVVPSGGEGESGRISVQPYRNQWLVQRMQRMSLHADDGSLQGADAVAVDRRYENAVIGDNAVFVIDGTRPDLFAEPGGGPEFLLREFRPSDGLRSIGAPVAVRTTVGRIARAEAIDGWIFLGGDDRTIAIPAPLPH
ncbi:MAG: PQQ-like beta-propeller repeat protein [Planctomycetes bacterium]|nr:PQQ-like beta-propeller repeat protein [Planctomycetota bacterium]